MVILSLDSSYIFERFIYKEYFSVSMKFKTSVTFDEDTIYGIRKLIREGIFRNKSHVVEYAVKNLIREKK